MLISKNKKMIAKSIALMLALVLTFSFVLTACKDKDARSDVTNLEANLGTLGDKVTALEEANKSNVTASALAETLAKYLETAKVNGIIDAAIVAALADYETKADAEAFVNTLLEKYVTSEALTAVLDGYYTKAQLDEVKAGLEALIDNCYTKADVYTKAEVDAIKAELEKDLTDALKNYYTIDEVEAIKAGLEKALTDALKDYYTQEQIKGIKDDLMAKIDNCYTKNDVYTKIEVSNQIAGVYEDLKNYWTAAQVGAADDALRTELTNNLTNALKAYYDIAGVDAAIKTAVDAAVADIIETLEGYYTIDAADAKIAAAIQVAVDAIEADLALVDAAIADRYTKAEADAKIAEAIEAAKGNTTTVLEGYYTKGATDDLIAGAKDYADAQIAAALASYYTKAEVDAMKSALDATIADLLAKFDDYYTAEDVDQYKADVDAYKLALEAAIDALAEQFGDYYTKEEVDGYKDEVDGYKAALEEAIAELLAKFDNYYDKDYIDTLIAGYFTKAEINEMFGNYFTKDEVAEYFEGEEGNAKLNALIKAYADANYVNKVDWKEATENVITTIASLADAMDIVDDSIYAKADWDTFTALVEETFGVTYADFSVAVESKLWIEVIRSINVEEFAKIETFVATADEIPTAQDSIDAINALIEALWPTGTAEGDINIYTAHKDALDEIKAAIVEFDTYYGFNEDSVNEDMNAAELVLAFTAGIALDADGVAAKLMIKNGYDANDDYCNDGGLRFNDYISMLNKYEDQMDRVAEIKTIIDGLVANCGAAPETLEAADRLTVTDLVGKVEAFLAGNNNDNALLLVAVDAETYGDTYTYFQAYRYFKWLEGKIGFGEAKTDAKNDLRDKMNGYAALIDNPNMNAANTEVLLDAWTAIDEIVYPTLDSEYEDPADYAYGVLGELVDETEATMAENYSEAVFAQKKQEAIADVEAYAAVVPEDKYVTVRNAIPGYVAELDAINPAKGGFAAALEELEEKADDALIALALMKTKIDNVAALDAFAAARIGEVDTGVTNYDEIVAKIEAATAAQYASINDAADEEAANAALATAKDNVAHVAYIEAVNLQISTYQKQVMDIIKIEVEFTGDGYTLIVELRNVGTRFAALDTTADLWVTEKTAALAELDVLMAKFNAKRSFPGAAKAAFEAIYVTDDETILADVNAAIATALADIAGKTTVAEIDAVKAATISALEKSAYGYVLAEEVAEAYAHIDAAVEAEPGLTDAANTAKTAIDAAVVAFNDDAETESGWVDEYDAAVLAIDNAVTIFDSTVI